ncbi:hypothetical protein HKD37_20G055975 [Glycine soja]
MEFVKAWTNKMLHLGNITTNRVESAHWALKRLLHNSLGELYITLYKRLIGMVSRYVLNQIASEFERVNYVGIESSHCGCIMRTSHGLSCVYDLARYVVGSIPLDTVHMFCQRLSFLDQGLSEPEVCRTEEMEAISKQFEELNGCDKVTLKSKLWEISYIDLNLMCDPPKKVKTKGAQKKQMTKQERSTKRDLSYWNSSSTLKHFASLSKQTKPKRKMPILDQFHPCIQDFIESIVDVKVDGNCGYRVIAALLGISEDSWSLVHNHLLKELGEWSDEYIDLRGVEASFMMMNQVTMDKWMNIIDMSYVIPSRYNVILVSLSLQQSMILFSLRSQPLRDSYVFLSNGCLMPSTTLLWSTHCHYQAKQWPTPYIS